MFLTTKALVLREVRYRESDKILTVLTENEGKLIRTELSSSDMICSFQQQSCCSLILVICNDYSCMLFHRFLSLVKSAFPHYLATDEQIGCGDQRVFCPNCAVCKP